MNTDNAQELAKVATATGTVLGVTLSGGPLSLGLIAGGPAIWAGAAIVGGCIWLAAKENSN